MDSKYTANGAERGKVVKQFVFTMTEKVTHEYAIVADSWKDARDQVEAARNYEADWCLSEIRIDGSFEGSELSKPKSSHINKLTTCAFYKMDQKDKEGRNRSPCYTYRAEDYKFEKNPVICNQCVQRIANGVTFSLREDEVDE